MKVQQIMSQNVECIEPTTTIATAAEKMRELDIGFLAICENDRLVGTVTDPSGGIVPNAQVTIIEEETGLVFQTQTNSAGEFVRPALKPSTYTISVTAPGFQLSSAIA